MRFLMYAVYIVLKSTLAFEVFNRQDLWKIFDFLNMNFGWTEQTFGLPNIYLELKSALRIKPLVFRTLLYYEPKKNTLLLFDKQTV